MENIDFSNEIKKLEKIDLNEKNNQVVKNFGLNKKTSWFGKRFYFKGNKADGETFDVRIRKKIHFWTNLFGDKWKKIEPENGKSFYIKEKDLQKIGLINPNDPSASDVTSKISKAVAPFFYKENKLLDKIGKNWKGVGIFKTKLKREIILALQQEQLKIADPSVNIELQTKNVNNHQVEILVVRNSDDSFSRYLLDQKYETELSLFLLNNDAPIDLDTGDEIKFITAEADNFDIATKFPKELLIDRTPIEGSNNRQYVRYHSQAP